MDVDVLHTFVCHRKRHGYYIPPGMHEQKYYLNFEMMSMTVCDLNI